MKIYIPEPIETKGVKVDAQILALSEVLAKNTHDVWSQEKINEGWSYGQTLDAENKKHPCLVPYEHLTEKEKDYDRNTSFEMLKVLLALGFKITKSDG